MQAARADAEAARLQAQVLWAWLDALHLACVEAGECPPGEHSSRRPLATAESKPMFPKHVRLQFDGVRDRFRPSQRSAFIGRTDSGLSSETLRWRTHDLINLERSGARLRHRRWKRSQADVLEIIQSWTELASVETIKRVSTPFAPAAPWACFAELTHRSPLPMPLLFQPKFQLLKAADRTRYGDVALSLFRRRRSLGVLQVHLLGGEPKRSAGFGGLVEA